MCLLADEECLNASHIWLLNILLVDHRKTKWSTNAQSKRKHSKVGISQDSPQRDSETKAGAGKPTKAIKKCSSHLRHYLSTQAQSGLFEFARN